MDNCKKFNYIALLLCAIACCAWSYVLDLQYYRLVYFSWDLPLYANLMWNLCHGHGGTTLFGGIFLIDHFNAIAFFLVPFYYFFQSALTMLYFKLFALFAGAYIFYLLAYKRVSGFWAIAFMLAYMFYPANVAMIFFEFNFENLALPMIFLLFYLFEEKRYLGFMISCFLLTIVKENMPLIVLMFGVYGFIVRRDDWPRWGLCPFLLGAGMFWQEVFVLIPWFRHGFEATNAHWSLYSRLGHSPREMISTLVFKWPTVAQVLFNSHNLSFLVKLFGPLLIAALLAPEILLIASPVFLVDLLSKNYSQQSIDSFYSSTLTVFIFMATITFLGRINTKVVPRVQAMLTYKQGTILKNIILGIIIFLLFRFDTESVFQWKQKVPPFDERQAVDQYFLSQIPPEAKVISSYKFLYLLSQRRDLYILYAKYKIFSHQIETIPDDVDYMVADFSYRLDNRATIMRALSRGPWTVQAAADDFVLLRKNRIPGNRLIESAQFPFPMVNSVKNVMPAGNALRMEGLKLPASLRTGKRIMPVVFYWKALLNDDNQNLPKVSLSIFQGSISVYCQAYAPLYGLPFERDKYYREIFYYFIPRLNPGKYKVVISILPPNNKGSIQTSALRVDP